MAANELFRTTLFTDANLQYYARLEGNYTDNSHNGITVTPTNSPTFTNSGQFGKGLALGSASSQYAEIAASSGTAISQMNSSQTWFAWINPSTNAAAQEPISCYDGASGLRRFQLNSGANGRITFQLLGLTTNNVVTASGTAPLNSWTFIAGVYSSASSYLQVFVNGTSQGSVTASGTVANTVGTGTFDIGRLGGGANVEYFNGTVDEFAIFNRALTNTEVSNYYQGLTPLRSLGDLYYTQF